MLEACTHLGEYRITDSVHGLMPVRKYHCLMCGASMAMDSLPQYLLKRMWGELEKAEAPSAPLVPVDFCVVLGGPNAVMLSQLCFESFSRTCTTTQGVEVHLVNRDLTYDEFYSIYKLFPSHWGYDRPPVPGSDKSMGKDTEWTCEWVSQNCGTKKFFVLCHFDLFFVGDFLNFLRAKVTNRTGMLGQHCPFMLLNREALAQSRLRFWASPKDFYVVPHQDEKDQCFLYCEGDRRIPPGAMRTGFDQGELLELELRALGWECDPLREEFNRHFYHFSGGDRVRDGTEFESIQRRAKMFAEEYKIF